MLQCDDKYRPSMRGGLLIAVALALAGCATASEPQRLSAAHPASVEAAQAPLPQASNVLRNRPPVEPEPRAGEPGVMHEHSHTDHDHHGDMDHGHIHDRHDHHDHHGHHGHHGHNDHDHHDHGAHSSHGHEASDHGHRERGNHDRGSRRHHEGH
jgi:hypothetical protein